MKLTWQQAKTNRAAILEAAERRSEQSSAKRIAGRGEPARI